MTDPRTEHADLFGKLDSGAGPARRLASARLAGMISSIADQVVAEAPAPMLVVAPPPARRGRVAVLAAAIVLVTASVAAATGAWLADDDEPVAAPGLVAAPPDPPRQDPPRAPAAPEVIVVPHPAPAVPPPPPPRDRPRREAAAPTAAPIDDLLAAANQHRREKRWRDAAALYEQVMRDHAGTDAAVVATVASASLRLDRLDDAAGALRRFQRALRARPSGPLAEEARWGIAAATRALGNHAAERDALDAFIAAHPRSPRLDAARRRLDELGAP